MTDRILLVGATGFLGSFVAARLMERHPVALVRASSDTSVLPRGMELRRGDLNGGPLPLDGISTVVYCASMVFGHVPRLVRQLEQRRLSSALFFCTTAACYHLSS